MTIKDILVALVPREEADPARNYALAMAGAYGAHLTAAAYAIVPAIPGSIYPEFVEGLVKRVQDEAEAAVKSARQRFEQHAQSAGVNHSFHGFSSFVHAVTTDFAMRLRTADIGILTQHKPDDPERFGDVFVEGALFRSGRPIIIVPGGFNGGFSTERVLIAWDGSVHATRVVTGAMPLLERGSIEVFTVAETSRVATFAAALLWTIFGGTASTRGTPSATIQIFLRRSSRKWNRFAPRWS